MTYSSNTIPSDVLGYYAVYHCYLDLYYGFLGRIRTCGKDSRMARYSPNNRNINITSDQVNFYGIRHWRG